MNIKGKYFEGDRQAQWTILQQELCKKYEGFGPEVFLKTVNNANQTDLKARCLTIVRKTSCITFKAVIQWIPSKLLVTVNEPVPFKKNKHRASFQHLKLYDLDSKY